jgi:hypothetical protein
MSKVVPEPDKRILKNAAVPPNTERQASSDEGEEIMIVHVSFLAYVRTMWSLLWTAFRYPFTTTYIDVASGAVIEGYEKD